MSINGINRRARPGPCTLNNLLKKGIKKNQAGTSLNILDLNILFCTVRRDG